MPARSEKAAAFLHQLGVIAEERGEYDEALGWCRRSLQIKEERGIRSGMASSYHQLGVIAEERREYGGASGWYRKSLQIKEELGNRFGMATSYYQLGMIAHRRGDYDEALGWYRKSLQVAEELGERSGMAASFSQIGVLLTERGAPKEAVPLNLRGLAIHLQIGSPQVGNNLLWLGRQHAALQEERFAEILAELLSPDDGKAVMELLAQSEKTGRSGPRRRPRPRRRRAPASVPDLGLQRAASAPAPSRPSGLACGPGGILRSTMTIGSLQEVHLSLPEALVREAEASGLLTPPAIEALLREELRKRRVSGLFEAADRLAALPGEPLTAEEVAAEVHEVRRVRRRMDAGGR